MNSLVKTLMSWIGSVTETGRGLSKILLARISTLSKMSSPPMRRGVITGSLWVVVLGALFLALPGACSSTREGSSYSKPLAWLSPAMQWLFGAKDAEFVTLEGGSFTMGDVLDNLRDARPHEVSLSPFCMARHEVTLELWDRVVKWGREHGYDDLPPGLGKKPDHPVYAVIWHDALKWCNARSEMEHRTPCYYVDNIQGEVFREGHADLTNRCVRWEADGYRLPTEAEWEMAARAGREGQRFPWGNEITHQDANYSGAADVPYDKSGHSGPAEALVSGLPFTAPVGSFPPNDFGLHDMSGNVWEWCWDFYDKHYGLPALDKNELTAMALTEPRASLVAKDPHGPEIGTTTVVRGGSWRHSATDARCASRYDLPGVGASLHTGFRLVRRP